MYRTVRDLDHYELHDLKEALFSEAFFDPYCHEIDTHPCLTEEDKAFLERVESPIEIPNDIVFRAFDGISFVDEDF